MGRLFRSFEEAWAAFLTRTEPMERLAPFERPDTLVWLVPVAPDLRPRLHELQAPLAALPFVRLLPGHYFHVTVALIGGGDIEELVHAGERAWRDVAPFEIAIRRVNCFHEVVIAEVETARWHLPERLAGRPLDFLLPHVTLAMTADGDPQPLREVVAPMRDADVGTQLVTHVDLCLVPTAPETFLQPWRVVGRVDLAASIAR